MAQIQISNKLLHGHCFNMALRYFESGIFFFYFGKVSNAIFILQAGVTYDELCPDEHSF